MSRQAGIETVRTIGRTLPDVEETTSWGAFALKVRGKMFVCTAINKQAEPNSLVVRMDFAQRDALIEEDPDTYYLKDHYVDYPCVLVRLSKVHPDALRDLVAGAHRFISATLPARTRATKAVTKATNGKKATKNTKATKNRRPF